MFRFLRLEVKHLGPFEENGKPEKKGVERCFVRSTGMTAVRGDLAVHQSNWWFVFLPSQPIGTLPSILNFPRGSGEETLGGDC